MVLFCLFVKNTVKRVRTECLNGADYFTLTCMSGMEPSPDHEISGHLLFSE